MEPPTDRPFPHRPPLPPLLRLPVSSLSTQPHDFVHLHSQLFSPVSPPLSLFLHSLPLRARAQSGAYEEKNEERKEKSEERKRGARDRARTLPRVSTISNRPEALEIRFGRLMIGTGGSGRSSSRGEPFLERPPGDRKETSLSLFLRERERGTRRSCLDRVVGERGGL